MKFLSIKSMLAALALGVCSLQSVATLITVNGSTEIEALNLSESFTDFYDHGGVTYSSNTGLEKQDTIRLFFAEYNNELALFTLLGGYNGNSGAATMSISDFATLGSSVLVDDAHEETPTGYKWVWASEWTDGMVYKINNPTKFDMNIAFSGLNSVDNIEFLSFSGGSQSALTTYNVDASGITASIPEPSTLAIFALGVIGLATRRNKKA